MEPPGRQPLGPWAHSPADGRGWYAAHDLRAHLESVAARAQDAASPLGEIQDLAAIAGLWHDLGKYQPAFQAYIQGKGPRVSHKLAGAQLALQRLDRKLGSLVALAIAGHHGGIPAWQSAFSNGLRDRLPEATAELAAATVAGVPGDILGRGLPSAALEAVDCLLRSIPQDDTKLTAELLIRMLFSCLVDADYLDTETFYEPQAQVTREQAQMGQSGVAELSRRLDDYLDSLRVPDTTVNRCRREILQHCRSAARLPTGIFELTAPTGGGKTLAAMSFALRHAVQHGLRRVIVVIPYTSIIEQNAARYASILGVENVLEHHSAWDADAASNRSYFDRRPGASYRPKLLAENWDAPIVVTTNVQFLESLHAHKPAACRKLHQVVGSVVVLDEVQTLPPHLVDPTLESLRALSAAFKVSVVTSTATQPALASRVDSMGYRRTGLGEPKSIIPDPAPLFASLKRVRVKWPSDLQVAIKWEDLAAELLLEDRVLAILHRRADARELARLVGGSVFHLSATMLPAHRSKTLAAVRQVLDRKGARCRVVSTQLVEAGVDLDFPVVYRAFAGLDSLAQAAGRCNREGLLDSGELRVFVAPTPPPRGVLTRAQDVARVLLAETAQRSTLLEDPDTYRRFYARLFDSASTDGAAISALRQGPRSDFPEIAKRYRLIEDAWQAPVVVPWSGLDQRTLAAIARLRAGYADRESWRRIQRATVSVRRETVASWAQSGVVSVAPNHPQAILNLESWPDLYSDQFGLDVTADPQLTIEELAV